MDVQEVSPSAYEQLAPKPYVVFNSVRFNQHVAPKCEAVKFLVFSTTKPRLGLIGGIRNGRLLSPFSAPYGGFSMISEHVHMNEYLEAAAALDAYAQAQGLDAVRVTLPPAFYHETLIAKQASALLNAGFRLEAVDLNSAYPLSSFDETYMERIPYAAKKNLKNGLKNGLQLRQVSEPQEKEVCYEIIRVNREAKGRTVKMSYVEVIETSKILPVDFFLVSHNETNVASAVVYTVNPAVVQVVYWGSLPEHEPLRPMNLLAFRLWEHYREKGVMIVDIGPSSLDSIPDPGLLDFKESIGCTLSLKLSFLKEYSR